MPACQRQHGPNELGVVRLPLASGHVLHQLLQPSELALVDLQAHRRVVVLARLAGNLGRRSARSDIGLGRRWGKSLGAGFGWGRRRCEGWGGLQLLTTS